MAIHTLGSGSFGDEMFATSVRHGGRSQVIEPPRAPARDVAIVLGAGFRGHTVVVTLDGREAYRATDVRTSPATAQADMFMTTTEAEHVHIAVEVTPGDLVLSADCNVGAHTRVVVSLIGKASLWLETETATPWSPMRLPG